jgi:hypothetical protein
VNAEKIVTRLTPLQADGLACGACGADYLHVHVPIGRSRTGSQVFACMACRRPSDQRSEPEGALR